MVRVPAASREQAYAESPRDNRLSTRRYSTRANAEIWLDPIEPNGRGLRQSFRLLAPATRGATRVGECKSKTEAIRC
jgi:hypothetical protein